VTVWSAAAGSSHINKCASHTPNPTHPCNLAGLAGVDPSAAVRHAAHLCEAHGVLARPWGLAGVWGRIVRQWLDELLPADAAERCNAARVGVTVTKLPLLKIVVLDRFKARAWAR